MTDTDTGQARKYSIQPYVFGLLFLCALVPRQEVVASEQTARSGPQHNKALRLRASNADIEFGRISSEDGVCRMNSRGTLMGYSGQTCLGSGRFAEFDLFGEKRRIVNISLAGSGSKPGIRFQPRMEGRQTKTLSHRGIRRLKVAGDLVLENASDGKHSLTYLIMVNYE
ncbi:MAG: DUF4402 domain-containing protein [Pseudomonadales bacterium]